MPRIIGTLLIFIGIIVLIYHPEKRLGRLSEPGVRWTLFSALLGAAVAIVDKTALRWFNVETYGFMVYFIPTVILCIFLPKRISHLRHLLKTKWKSALCAIIMSAASYYFTLKAFTLAEITFVYPLLQLTTIFTVLGGVMIMKEKQHLLQKAIAVILIIAASFLLKM